MDWFESITGFKELDYAQTQRQLTFNDGCLVSRATGARWAVGALETPALHELRARAVHLLAGGPTRLQCVVADARALHRQAAAAGALFQVASQFNLLEMAGPDVSPEQGVTRYIFDRTQGPACAIAAGAATIYRNYRVPVGRDVGQRKNTQIDCLADMGRALGNDHGSLWSMRNGYALCTAEGLDKIDRHLQTLDEAGLDCLRGELRTGLHWQVDVTDQSAPGHRVSQAFCSALPVAYSSLAPERWARFGQLVLEAAYEATLLAAAINKERHACRTIFLTSLGGGAFGNKTEWIHAAMRRALTLVSDAGLDVRIVAYGSIPSELSALVREWA